MYKYLLLYITVDWFVPRSVHQHLCLVALHGDIDEERAERVRNLCRGYLHVIQTKRQIVASEV